MADMKYTVGNITFNTSPITVTQPTQGRHDKIIIEANERVVVAAGEYIRTSEAQEAEIKRLRRALEFYANKDNYKIELSGCLPNMIYTPNKLTLDGGKIAQAALKE